MPHLSVFAIGCVDLSAVESSGNFPKQRVIVRVNPSGMLGGLKHGTVKKKVRRRGGASAVIVTSESDSSP